MNSRLTFKESFIFYYQKLSSKNSFIFKLVYLQISDKILNVNDSFPIKLIKPFLPSSLHYSLRAVTLNTVTTFVIKCPSFRNLFVCSYTDTIYFAVNSYRCLVHIMMYISYSFLSFVLLSLYVYKNSSLLVGECNQYLLKLRTQLSSVFKAER